MGDGIVTVDLPQGVFVHRRGTFNIKSFRPGFRSSFAPSRPEFGPGGELLWSFRADSATLDRAETIEMEAFFARLAGRDWAFRAYDTFRQWPLGAGNGFKPGNSEILFTGDDAVNRSFCSDLRLLTGSNSARVAEAAPRGATSILIEGLDTALAGLPVLKKGDHFNVGLPSEFNLHMAMSNAVCDAAGRTRINFLAPLWKRALADDHVEFYRPTARFALYAVDDNGSVELVRSSSLASSGTLQAIEWPYQEPN